MVHKNGTGLHTGKGTIGTQYHGAQVVVVSHAAKHNFSILSGQAWRRSVPRSVGVGIFSAPRDCFGFSAVVYRHLVAGQGQMCGHGIAHHTKS